VGGWFIYKKVLHSHDFLEDSLTIDLSEVSGLDLNTNSDKLLSDGILGGSVEHLGLDLGGIGSPHDEKDFVTLTTVGFIRKVEDGISAVTSGERFDEILISGSGGGGGVDDDGGVVSVQLEQRIAK
jgi:hypothetical protein